ncbi:MAG: DUF1501 domain-containing protein [Lewinellaceae bacterium]|jgi:uncharacterized protein (DUF1501 family)|nr:DUF1501 domain-containing protein [Lewinellaceae bacterium]
MKRRNFLKIFPAAGVTPFAVNGFPMRPFANSKIAKIMATCDGVEDRVLVLIQLKGGNDGLNMIIPVQQYDLYAALRPSIRIPDAGADKYIDLDNTLSAPDKVGLHPVLTGMKDLYDDGALSIVQGVGYQDMNQSHFKGTDLWLSGGDGTPDKNNIGSGWMGRALQAMYPDVTGAPTADMPDPLGIQIGDPNPSLGFHTETQHQNVINLSGQDPAGFYSLIQTIGGAPLLNVPDTEYGEEIAYIQGVENSLSLYAQRISDTFNAGSNALNDYPDTTLANQLKTIARLIAGGCKTKIYLCSMGGFDTHGAQVVENMTTIGNHANLLKTLSDSVKYFFDDLKALGVDDQVTACTFSEFGRTAKENGSLGSDHGTLAPMFLFGKNIQAGVNGTNVNLGVLTQDNQLMDMQFDYRQVFTTLLQDWLGANNFVLEQTMFEGYAKIPAIDPAYVVSPDCYFGTTSIFDPYKGQRPLAIYPNPASISAEVTFQSTEAFNAVLSIHSLGGSLISANSVVVQPGSNLFYIDVVSLPAGPYFVRLENRFSGKAEVVKLSVVR